jgi:hypothetical protein
MIKQSRPIKNTRAENFIFGFFLSILRTNDDCNPEEGNDFAVHGQKDFRWPKEMADGAAGSRTSCPPAGKARSLRGRTTISAELFALRAQADRMSAIHRYLASSQLALLPRVNQSSSARTRPLHSIVIFVCCEALVFAI